MILQPKNTIGFLAALTLVGGAMWGSVLSLQPPMHKGTVEITQVVSKQIDSDPQPQVSVAKR